MPQAVLIEGAPKAQSPRVGLCSLSGAPQTRLLGILQLFLWRILATFCPWFLFCNHMCKTPKLLNLSIGNLPQIPGKKDIK